MGRNRLFALPGTRMLGRVGRDRSGSAVVELAFVVPAMIAMLLVVVEFGTMLTAQGVLDTAALRASRTGSTGYTPDGSTRDQYMRDFIAAQAFGLLKANKVAITATSYASFDDVDKEGKGSPGFGGSGQVVKYTLSYPWTGITSLFGKLLTSGQVNLTASLAVRNETW